MYAARTFAIAVLLLTAFLTAAGQDSANPPAQDISYASPAGYPQLPAAIRTELQSRGCRIPQPYSGPKLQNAIRGHFARPRQTDFAVLCSRQGISSILVFWNGSAATPVEVAPAPDRNFLTVVENGEWGFARAISPASAQFIRKHWRSHGGPTPPSIDHEGIDDQFLEKGSTVRYFRNGQWLELTGSD